MEKMSSANDPRHRFEVANQDIMKVVLSVKAATDWRSEQPIEMQLEEVNSEVTVMH